MTGLRSWDRCASCRDFLDLALASARELSRIERRLAAMSEGEGLRAAPLCGPVSGGSRDGGGMARTDARIDYEAKLSGRVGECRRVADDLRALCYGTSSGVPAGDGILGLRSPADADAVWLRFGLGCSWSDVAESVGYSVRWCQQSVATTCEIVDAVGFERAADGVGHASDD